MGQYFEFINLDNPFPVRTSVGGKFGEFFWDISDMTDREVMQALWQPEESHKFRVVTIEPYSQLKRPEKRLDILDRYTVFPEESLANATLPIELVSMILEEVEDLADIVCFVLTCQRYFEIGRPILEARSEEILTYSWAGNRLICAGDYAMIDDLPEGMLTEYEKKLLDEKFGTDNTDDVWEQLSFVQSLQPDWHLNQKRTTLHTRHVKTLFHHFMDLRMPYRASKNVPPRMALAGTRDFAVLTELTVEDTPRGLPYGLSQTYESYVLRNLTTKEYIRGAAVHEAWNTPDMPYLRALRFMHLLVLRITWSHDSSLTIAYEGPIQVHRGVWAGHRFDFCDIKTVEDGQGTMGDWNDVSKVVIDELVAVFEEEADDLNERSSDWDWD